jgi:hypothetical protein
MRTFNTCAPHARCLLVRSQLDTDEFALPTNKRNRHNEGLSVMDTDNAGMYRPKTKETRDAFETLLAVIHTQFGEQPQVCVCAHSMYVPSMCFCMCMGKCVLVCMCVHVCEGLRWRVSDARVFA